MATKDFAPIEDDYAFFMSHATEAENDAAAYARTLAGFAEGRSQWRVLDFGCGNGEFSERLLTALRWPRDRVRLTLVEPVSHQREAAARRLSGYTGWAIEQLAELSQVTAERYEIVIANHVLYYVDSLEHSLQRMHELLVSGGKLLIAISGWDNALMQLWQTGFRLAGRPVPYYAADDVKALLDRDHWHYRTVPVPYELTFPDSEQNRLKILRFLFGEHLPSISATRMLPEFDRFQQQDQIVMITNSNQFVIEQS